MVMPCNGRRASLGFSTLVTQSSLRIPKFELNQLKGQKKNPRNVFDLLQVISIFAGKVSIEFDFEKIVFRKKRFFSLIGIFEAPNLLEAHLRVTLH